MNDKIKSHHLERKAILHIRQSSAYQVNRNLDSQNRASMPITHEQISVPIDGRSIVEAYTKRRLLHDLVTRQIEQVHGMHQQKAAVLSGYWPSLRYDPRLRNQGKNPFQLDSKAPGIPFKDYAYQETRYSMLARSDPEKAGELLRQAEKDVLRRWCVYESRAAMPGEPKALSAELPEPEPVLAGAASEKPPAHVGRACSRETKGNSTALYAFTAKPAPQLPLP